MNFNFPPLSSSPEQWRQRLLPLALLALALHSAVVLLPAPRRQPGTAASRVPLPADDTPELLRLSRSGSSDPGRLNSVPLGSLPPPPPSLLPSQAPGTELPLSAPPAAQEPSGTGLPLPPLPARLADAAASLRLLIRQTPAASLTAADRDQLAGLQRRQLWLSAAQDALAQQLWQRATAVEAAPEALGKLPEEAELRRLPTGVAAILGTGAWHGRSLLGRDGALLLWEQGGRGWLLRLPAAGESRAETLTSP